jgi:hypothetical protein
MARIPMIQSTRGVGQRANAEAVVRRGPNGLQAVGAALSDVGGALNAYVEREQQQQASAGVATFDYTKRLLERQSAAPADGGDFYRETTSDYDEAVNEHVSGIENARVRQTVRDQLMGRKPGVLSSAARFEVGARQTANRQEANNALEAVSNRVRSGGEFDTALADGEAVIAARPLPEQMRNEMSVAFRQNLSNSYFQSRIDGARSESDLQQIKAELTSSEDRWQGLMEPRGFARTLDAIDTQMRSLRSANKAEATASLEALNGRNTDGVLIPAEEMQSARSAVARSGDPKLVARLSAIEAQQDVYRRKSGIRADELRSAKGSVNPMAGLPSRLQTAINKFASPSVPASYLATLARTEYGVYLKGEQTDFGQGTIDGSTSAVGVAQMTNATWLDFARRGLNGVVSADKLRSMSDTELLELRKDPEASMAVAVHMAASRKAEAEGMLRRQISEPEMYMTHLLGTGGAVTMLRAFDGQSDAAAADVLPNAAKNNRGLFYAKDGRPLSVTEFHANITAKFETAPGRVEYARDEAYQKLIDRQETALRTDPMSYAAETGRVPGAASPIDFNDPSSLEVRGRAVTAVSEYYRIPMDTMKPLTADEEAQVAKTIAEGTPEEITGMLAGMQAMGGRAATAAYRQIGLKEPAIAHAAGLATVGRSPEVALSVVRGQQRLREDKTLRAGVGLGGSDASAAMHSLVGGALSRMPPRAVNAIYEAASARYADQMAITGRAGDGVIDTTVFEAALRDVIGGADAMDTVNGATTIIPQGVKADQVEDAMASMSDSDLMRLSADGRMPVFADGSAVTADDIETEGILRMIGKDLYHVEMADGALLTTGEGDAGSVRPYVMRLSGSAVLDLLSRQEQQAASQASTSGMDPVRPVRGEYQQSIERVQRLNQGMLGQ